ncbi:MAG: DUF1579 domain-containing protein [Xanthomonadales bacterium]|nr:DUF1579 domain-containing protein [Xanthomonadales bacterium]
MGAQAFEDSLHAGRHQALSRFVGRWRGTTRVWFEPGDPVDQAPIEGTIRAVLGGRFLIHEYETRFMGARQEGIAIIGWHIDGNRHEMAWIDSGHTGTQLMFCEGEAGADAFSVLGHYGGHDGSEPWGWRTAIEADGDDRLVITAWNIQPGEAETRAIETVYERVRD